MDIWEFSEPFFDDLFSNSGFKTPHIWVFDSIFNNFRQTVRTAVMSADPLVQLQGDPLYCSAVENLSLVIDVSRPEALHLDTSFEIEQALEVGFSVL